MRTIINIALFFIAIVLSPLLVAGMLYSFFVLMIGARFKDWWNRIGDYFYRAAIGIDQLGNTMCQDLFNHTLIKNGGYLFGNVDETISSVLGKNKLSNTLSLLGRLLDSLLHLLDEDHSINSIEKNP